MIKDNNGIFVSDKSQTIGLEFHEKRGKPALLRALTNDPTHQINWETPYYNTFIDECLEGLDLSNKVCLDLGCSDGRFTEYLIKKGVKKVIALDADYQPLYDLSQYCDEEGFREKVQLIHGGAENIPIDDNSVDIVLALGVYYYLGEQQEKGMMETYRKMKENGILISSEPNLEGIALKSLLFDSLDEMVSNFTNNDFREGNNDLKYRFPLHEEDVILTSYGKVGLKFENKKGLSLFHQIIRIMYVKGMISKEELNKKLNTLREIFDYLDDNGYIYKTIMYKHKK